MQFCIFDELRPEAKGATMKPLLLGVALWLSSALAWGQEVAAPPLLSPPAAESGAEGDGAEDAANRFIAGLVREHLPREYEDTRRWGGTKRVQSGLDVRLDGLQLKTKRRWKEVNHGTWKMYRVWLLDPNEQLELTIANLRRQEDGSVAFDLHAGARLGLLARIAEWRRDVQLFSISAQGEARVRLTVQCQLAMRLDPRKLPPDLVLAPKVHAADLQIDEFHIDRISKVGGDIAEEIGRGMRRALEEKLAEDRTELADKFNRQIAKNQEKLRLSLHDALASKWGEWIDADALPPSM